MRSCQNVLSPEQQKLHRNHSFQLVRLQSEVSNLKAQREKDVKHMEALQDQMSKLYVDLANAKGVMGRIRIECHSRGHGATSSPARNTPATVTNSQMDVTGNTADILERVKNAKGDIEGLADAILEEQRPKLITGLVSIYRRVVKVSNADILSQTALNSVVDNWTLDKRMKGNADRLSSIYMKEEEDKENVPPADEY